MSLQSWKKEFYHTEASDIDNTPDAIEHSITKWKGLLPENLNKHRLVLVEGTIYDIKGKYMTVSSSTCALCQIFIERDCPDCPLKNYLGKRCDEGDDSPYMIFNNSDDPKAMIEALELSKSNYYIYMGFDK